MKHKIKYCYLGKKNFRSGSEGSKLVNIFDDLWKFFIYWLLNYIAH